MPMTSNPSTGDALLDPLTIALSFLDPCGSRRSAGRCCRFWRLAARRARVRSVGVRGCCSYRTAREAVEAALPFEEVRFAAGEYSIDANLVIDRPIMLVGAEGATLVLRRGVSVVVEHAEGRIRGLTLAAAGTAPPPPRSRLRGKRRVARAAAPEDAAAATAAAADRPRVPPLHPRRWGSHVPRDTPAALCADRVPLLVLKGHGRSRRSRALASYAAWNPLRAGAFLAPSPSALVPQNGVDRDSACVEIEDCTFLGSSDGGGVVGREWEGRPCVALSQDACARIVRTTVRNGSIGVGLRDSACVEIVDSTFEGCNCGVEINSEAAASSVVQNCRFRGSAAPPAEEEDQVKEGSTADPSVDSSVGIVVYNGRVAAVGNAISGFGVGVVISGGSSRGGEVEQAPAPRFQPYNADALALDPLDRVPPAASALRDAGDAPPPQARSTPFDVGLLRNDVGACTLAAVLVQGGSTPKLECNALHHSPIGVLLRGPAGSMRAASRNHAPTRIYLKANVVSHCAQSGIAICDEANPLLKKNWILLVHGGGGGGEGGSKGGSSLLDARALPVALSVTGKARVEASENIFHGGGGVIVDKSAEALLVENSVAIRRAAMSCKPRACVSVLERATAQLSRNALFGGGVTVDASAAVWCSANDELPCLADFDGRITSGSGLGCENTAVYRSTVAKQMDASRKVRRQQELRKRALRGGAVGIALAASLGLLGAFAWAVSSPPPAVTSAKVAAADDD